MIIGLIGLGFTIAGTGIKLKEYFENRQLGEEIIRRDEARREFSMAQSRWQRSVALYMHDMQRLRQRLTDANASLGETNKALDELKTTLVREPRLEDFYTPSPEMVKYQTMKDGLIGLVVGWVGYKAYKYTKSK